MGSELIGAAHSAFVNVMAIGMRVAVGVAMVCAIGAVFALPQRRPIAVGNSARPGPATARSLRDLVLAVRAARLRLPETGSSKETATEYDHMRQRMAPMACWLDRQLRRLPTNPLNMLSDPRIR
jgi:hypothetical protein